MKNKWFINLFLCFTKITGFLPMLLFFKPRVFKTRDAKRQLPKGAIMVSNHKSLMDFILYLIVFPFRTIRFLMAEVLYNKNKPFSFMLNSLGGIKVDRDAHDFSFISEVIECLEKKDTIGIFPEARLPINGKPWPFTTSTAFIATKIDVPIVPVYTDGNYGLWKRAHVCIGEAFHLSDYIEDGLTESEQLEHLTKVLETKVYELKSFTETRKQHHRFFTLKNLSMDLARLVCAILPIFMRIKRKTPQGKKYKGKIRGGALIAANHTSFLDPFIVGVTFWYRRLYFLVAEIVMQGKLRSMLLRGVGAIKIDRNAADIEAIKKSIEKLKKGYLLSVFPQGGINRDDDIDAIKSGAALLAVKAGVPIIPMHIPPKKHWYNRRIVVIGNTINPKDYLTKKIPSTQDINNISVALMNELNLCKNSNNQSLED
ncbi:MAG: 1-acyl-sn-glycerol-3-phosphate acyltransferase [Ruminococcaceae bacterium]|nr:1-acyl-sn-glycerol-3-phosphate acyltransferase [Oscillospiraceae bacterium]